MKRKFSGHSTKRRQPSKKGRKRRNSDASDNTSRTYSDTSDPNVDDVTSSEAASLKPPAAKRPNIAPHGNNQNSSSLDASTSSGVKRRGPIKGKKAAHRRVSSELGVMRSATDEWTFHDPERDLCAHRACQKPQQMNINWVQCDDCDGWYHSLCAFGSNTTPKQDADFHCGCRSATTTAKKK